MAVLHEGTAPPLAITSRRPALVFSEYLIHYGPDPVEAKAVEEATFFFHNAGTETVEFGKLSPSCGCLSPRLSKNIVVPGDGGRLTIPIAVSKESPGPHEYLVTVEYKDPHPQEVTLTVKIVLPEKQVLIEPRALWIIGSGTNRAVEHSIRITDYREQPMQVEEVQSSSELFTAELKPSESRNGSSVSTIGVRITENLPDGIHRGIIQVRTSDPENQLLQIPIMARGKERPTSEPIFVKPELISMNAIADPSADKSVEITFPATWNVSRIDTSPLELTATYEELPTTNPGMKTLKVTTNLSSLPPSKILDGVINLIADEGQHMISVPVQFHWPTQM
ncbi:MAG: DUF1573 domain-containing protein [Planctomyces sp.]|nr:DUF1573 domain-containing protein [Planctomyces sp.]